MFCCICGNEYKEKTKSNLPSICPECRKKDREWQEMKKRKMGGLTMAKYRKKPVVIEAVQWTGMNDAEIEDFVGDALEGYGDNLVAYYPRSAQYNSKLIFIKTLEGTMTASVGDYIIRGVNGEFYPCKPDVFEKTYEIVEDLQ